jgi:NAD(P)-dependent dehydrogenase (short-subunit alcohol dehydrogenase family)
MMLSSQRVLLSICVSVAQEIEALGVKALPIACDVTDSEQVNTLIEKALTEFVHIDSMVDAKRNFTRVRSWT